MMKCTYCMAVSYTHLDVYKRQLFCCVPYFPTKDTALSIAPTSAQSFSPTCKRFLQFLLAPPSCVPHVLQVSVTVIISVNVFF